MVVDNSPIPLFKTEVGKTSDIGVFTAVIKTYGTDINFIVDKPPKEGQF